MMGSSSVSILLAQTDSSCSGSHQATVCHITNQLRTFNWRLDLAPFFCLTWRRFQGQSSTLAWGLLTPSTTASLSHHLPLENLHLELLRMEPNRCFSGGMALPQYVSPLLKEHSYFAVPDSRLGQNRILERRGAEARNQVLPPIK